MSPDPDTMEAGNARRPVLIGVLTRPVRGSIATITSAFMEGLGGRYAFAPFVNTRAFGVLRGARLNPLNFFYGTIHLIRWSFLLLRTRPAIAHYPVTSGWNLEKSLLLLRIARLNGARTIGHLHGGSFDLFWNRLGPTRRRYALRNLARLDAFVVLSDGWRTWAAHNLGLPAHRIHVVNNPIDARFEHQALACDPRDAAPSVLFLGTLGERKGVYDVLAAAALLHDQGHDVPLTVAGPEEDHGSLARVRKLREERGLVHVGLAGPAYGEDKVRLFTASAIFLFPSRRENFPLVILEAAAAARAIITTRVGALPEFFRHEESVLFVEPGEVRAIASAVLRLTGDPGLRVRLGEAARRVFRERLARGAVMAAMDAVYDDVLRHHG